MLIKYFEYIIIAVIIAAVVLPAFAVRWRMRLYYIQKLVKINVLRRQQKSDNIALYSSEILDECCRLLYMQHSKDAKKSLRFLAIGKIDAAVKFMEQHNKFLAMLLAAHQNAEAVYRKIFKIRNKWLKQKKYAVYLPILAHLCHDNKNFSTIIAKISDQSLYQKNPYYNFIIAYAYLNEGDMLSASMSASKAQKEFKRRKMVFEEINCNFILAEIYRISCVPDIAQTMLETAVKILQNLKLNLLMSKAVALLGMLMLFENRYEEAEDKYLQALNFTPTTSLKADIYNQLALLYIVTNKPDTAKKFLREAHKLFTKSPKSSGLALCLQLRGQLAFNQQHYQSAEKYLYKSLNLYESQANFSAVSECLYLTAEADYKLQKYNKAEKKLRNILKICRLHKNNFHVANAYTLLGLIYLNKNEHQRAKVLFQQALHLEQNHNRNEGLVVDYTNLALIEQLSGNCDAAANNLTAALEYAKQTEDKTLQELISKKLKTLS